MSKLLAPLPVGGCTNPAHQYLSLAPIPCPDCRGWLDRDGTVLNRQELLARYPSMASQLAASADWQLPDYAGATRGEQLLAGNRLIGALARTGLAIIFAAGALALCIYLIVKPA